MRTLGTASWCLWMPRIHTAQATVSVFRAFWNWCRRRRLDSMCSSWICAGKGGDCVVLKCRIIHRIQIGNSYIGCHHSNNGVLFQKCTWWRHAKCHAQSYSQYCVWICHVSQCLSFSSRNSTLKYILFWHVMLRYIIFVKLPRCWGVWVEFKWIHQWSLYQIPEGAPPRGWEDNCSARQCGWRWGKGTMSMLKLNKALQLLLVKCWSIKLKQMINWFEKSATIFSTYLVILY